MQAVSTEQMRKLDQTAIRRFKIPSLILMENAGRGIAAVARQMLPPKGRVIVVCGTGNNGGDAMVCARHLANQGCAVHVFVVGRFSRLKGDARVNYDITRAMKIPVRRVAGGVGLKQFQRHLRRAALVVDGLFGVGLHREVMKLHAQVIEAINGSGASVLAVDIPSGLCSDSGRMMGVAVKADRTATLGAPKLGLLRAFGPQMSGKIDVIDISLPRLLLES